LLFDSHKFENPILLLVEYFAVIDGNYDDITFFMLSLSGGFVRQRSRGAAIRSGERFGASSLFMMNYSVVI